MFGRVWIDAGISVKRSAIGTAHACAIDVPPVCGHGNYFNPDCPGCVAQETHVKRIEKERALLTWR